jgi:hypothetical protein
LYPANLYNILEYKQGQTLQYTFKYMY